MRLRRRKKDRRYGCTTIGSSGYTLIETVVSLAIFVIAATVFYMIFQHAAVSYGDQCRMELAGEICRDARRKIDWRLRNARHFWVNGREAGRRYLQEEEDGGWEILTADDFQAGSGGKWSLNWIFRELKRDGGGGNTGMGS